MQALLTLHAHRWPFVSVGGRPARAGDYTSMDYGRLLYIAAVADGAVEPQFLGEAAFHTAQAMQGAGVRRFLRRN